MLLFNKYKSNLKTLSEKTLRHKKFPIILWSALTRHKKKVHLQTLSLEVA